MNNLESNNPILHKELIKIVGKENYSNDELDRLFYSSDMAALPAEIFQMYGFKKPDYIVMPTSTEQVAAIVGLANKHNVPVTPRGGASTGYGGSVPVNGGIVLDLTKMKNILELNEDKKTVTVQCGITWKELVDFLEKRGFQLGIYPSSAYTATVGGFICMGGSAGIGAPKYGSIGKQIDSLKVVMANAEIVDTVAMNNSATNSTNLFVGSEGIFGIVSEVSIRIYPKEEVVTCAVTFDTLEDSLKTINEILKKNVTPHTLHLMDETFLNNLKKVDVKDKNAAAMILVAFEGSSISDAEKYKKIFLKICNANNGKDLGTEEADIEWKNRFKIELLFKRLGPTLIPLEVLAPIENMSEIIGIWRGWASKKNIDLSIFAILGDEQQILLMPMALTDERNKGQFVKTVAILIKMLEESLKLGKLYSIGVHNAPYADSKLGENLGEYLKIKANVDPKNILNPYKVVRPCIPSWVFKPAMSLMAALPAWLDNIFLKIAGMMPLNDFN